MKLLLVLLTCAWPLVVSAQDRTADAVRQQQADFQRADKVVRELGGSAPAPRPAEPSLRLDQLRPTAEPDGTWRLPGLSAAASRALYLCGIWLLLGPWAAVLVLRVLPGQRYLARTFKAGAGVGLLGLPGVATALCVVPATGVVVALALGLEDAVAPVWGFVQHPLQAWPYGLRYPAFGGTAAVAAICLMAEVLLWPASRMADAVLARQSNRALQHAVATARSAAVRRSPTR